MVALYVNQRETKRKRNEEKKKLEDPLRRTGPNASVVIYVSFWYRYSVARRDQCCTSQSIAVRRDKPVGHKTEISQPPKYNAAINRNRNSPLPFNRNAEGKNGLPETGVPVLIFTGRDEHALFATKSRQSRLPAVDELCEPLRAGMRHSRSNCNIT